MTDATTPWTAGKMNIANLDGFRVHRIPISAGGMAIAAVWCGSVGKEFMDGPKAGREHAALIVAAPVVAEAARAMLAALEAIRETVAGASPLYGIGGPSNTHASLVAAAIAQAKAAGITTEGE